MRRLIDAKLREERTRLIERIRNGNPDLANELASVKFDWFRVRNASGDEDGATNDTAELFIYDEIGGWFGTPVSDLVKELQGITAANLDVRINSPGGSLFDSIAIYNALVKHPATVTTYVDALAASGASIIAMAGTKCVMMVGSQMMIHDALGVELGNAAAMRAMADFLDAQSDNIATIYAEKAGGDPKDWRALMLAETWMFAAEAVEMGLADEIYSAPTDAPYTEEETPGPEEEEPPSEEPDEDEPGMDEDEELENLMHNRHPLAAFGYKYAGRSKAPKPVVNELNVDEIISAFQRVLK